jgi:hypothetical protein
MLSLADSASDWNRRSASARFSDMRSASSSASWRVRAMAASAQNSSRLMRLPAISVIWAFWLSKILWGDANCNVHVRPAMSAVRVAWASGEAAAARVVANRSDAMLGSVPSNTDRLMSPSGWPRNAACSRSFMRKALYT